MRVFLLAFCILAITSGAQAQVAPDKITPEEYIEGNELARKFFDRFTETLDLKPLIKEFGTSDFDRCSVGDGFAFVQEEQLKNVGFERKVRYYYAEANFLTALFLWGSTLKESDDYLDFNVFPKRVRRSFSKTTFDAIIKNDSISPESLSDRDNLKYFNAVLSAFERSGPILRDEVKKADAKRSPGFKKAMDDLEFRSTIAKYLFAPELDSNPEPCDSVAVNGRVIYVDIPFFQLHMVRDRGRLRIFRMPFHID